jgi:hypothetical protein
MNDSPTKDYNFEPEPDPRYETDRKYVLDNVVVREERDLLGAASKNRYCRQRSRRLYR